MKTFNNNQFRDSNTIMLEGEKHIRDGNRVNVYYMQASKWAWQYFYIV